VTQGREVLLRVFEGAVEDSEDIMERKPLFWPLTGAVLIGFAAGACVQRIPHNGQSTGKNDNLSERIAQAQAETPAGGVQNSVDLQRLSATFASIAKQVTPAVVNVNTEQVIPGRVFRDPFSEFFGDSAGGLYREPDRRSQSLGSGVIVDGRGVIVTNNHVVENASTITVTLKDRRRFAAKLLGTDAPTDLAVLKIDSGKPLPVVPWASSDALQVGDIVLAIGSPFNLASTVTQGIISAKERRDLGISMVEDFLQTDAAINPGNSGGALVDINGRLVGINTAILSRTGGNQGIGLAIPSRLARKISGQLLASGRVTRGWIGIIAEPVTDEIAAQLNIGSTSGVIVTGVLSSGPAAQLPWARSGGNVLLKANGTPIDSPGQLRNLIADLTPGSVLALEVWQNGKTRVFNVTVGRRTERAQGV
jgi:Do/DeqQ family serine protease